MSLYRLSHYTVHRDSVIASFRHQGLKELFEKGRSATVPASLAKRCTNRLDALDAAGKTEDLNLPGFRLHQLHGGRYAISVNGPWRLTFDWENGSALRVDLEQYH